MTGRIHIAERGEPFTVRELKEMVESKAFNILLARIDRMIEAERSSCEAAETVDQIRRAQGAVKALRTVKQLPSILIAELQPKGTQ